MSDPTVFEHINVAVCIPSQGVWTSSLGSSLAIMAAEFMTWRPEGCKTKLLQVLTREGSMLVQQRHDLVLDALRSGATHLLFLDADMVFPKHLLQRFISHDKDIVGANCTTRRWPIEPIAADMGGVKLDSRGRRGIEQVQQVGLAVVLIKRKVLEALRPPMFMMDWIPTTQSYCGEDIYFTQLAQDAGFEVWVDHDISKQVYHTGPMSFGHDLMALGPQVAAVIDRRQAMKDEHHLATLKQLGAKLRGLSAVGKS